LQFWVKVERGKKSKKGSVKTPKQKKKFNNENHKEESELSGVEPQKFIQKQNA